MNAEASVGAAAAIGATGVFAAQLVAAGSGVEGVTAVEALFGAAGGLLGGLMFAVAMQYRDKVDAGIAVLVSAGLGAVAAPTAERILTTHYSGLVFGDPWVAALCGSVIGAFVPAIYPLLIAIIATAKENPKGVVQFVVDAVKRARGK